MKNKIKLLALSSTTILAMVATLKSTSNDYEINTKLNNQEGIKIAKALNNETSIDFKEGNGSEYLSNVKVQYAYSNEASSLRFVAAVKGTINSYSDIELPGQYGFHISYEKEVNGSVVLQDFMYDVDYIYHSMGENIDGKTTYYTNEFSTYSTLEGCKSIQDWTQENDSEYNLFIALELNNIPSGNLDNIITIQPYLKLDNGEVVTSSNYRYSTVNNAKALTTGYYLHLNNELTSMQISSDNKYNSNLSLNKGDKVELLNHYGEVVATYTSTLTADYKAIYDNTDFKVITNVNDTLLEAEDGVYSHGSTAQTFTYDQASGGMGACNFNDCGQGISLMYYSYFAKEYDVEIGYWTGSANSKSAIYVNGEYQTTAIYKEATGWANGNETSIVTVSLTFVQGWNTISLSKDGTSSDSPEYGGYVMYDYVKILGTEDEFDPNEFDTSKPTFRVEAEHGNFSTGELPKNDANNESSGYYIGSFDNYDDGDNVTFNFKAPLSGEYDLQIGYAKGDNAPTVDVTVNDEFVETVSFDDYENQNWNNFNLNSHKTRITLSSENMNSLKVAINKDCWLCFDYIVLTYVGE